MLSVYREREPALMLIALSLSESNRDSMSRRLSESFGGGLLLYACGVCVCAHGWMCNVKRLGGGQIVCKKRRFYKGKEWRLYVFPLCILIRN